jgi:hypothetical protein
MVRPACQAPGGQPSLRDLDIAGWVQALKAPGYCRASLRDHSQGLPHPPPTAPRPRCSDNALDSIQHGYFDARMRTTLTLDPDVAAKAKQRAARLGKPLKEVVNAALRIGLDAVLNPPPGKPYRTKPHPMGLRRGLSYDNIGDL